MKEKYSENNFSKLHGIFLSSVPLFFKQPSVHKIKNFAKHFDVYLNIFIYIISQYKHLSTTPNKNYTPRRFQTLLIITCMYK